MKPSHLFLSATLALNLMLGGALWLKAHPHFFESALPPASAPVSAPDPLLAALVSGDAAALRSAGAPDEVARDLALGHALARLQVRLRAVQPASPADPRYWRNAAYLRNPYTREQRAEIADGSWLTRMTTTGRFMLRISAPGGRRGTVLKVSRQPGCTR